MTETLTITTETQNSVSFLNEIGALDKTWEQIDWLCDNGFESLLIKHVPTEYTFDADIRRYEAHESPHFGGTETHFAETEVEIWHNDKWHAVPQKVHGL